MLRFTISQIVNNVDIGVDSTLGNSKINNYLKSDSRRLLMFSVLLIPLCHFFSCLCEAVFSIMALLAQICITVKRGFTTLLEIFLFPKVCQVLL